MSLDPRIEEFLDHRFAAWDQDEIRKFNTSLWDLKTKHGEDDEEKLYFGVMTNGVAFIEASVDSTCSALIDICEACDQKPYENIFNDLMDLLSRTVAKERYLREMIEEFARRLLTNENTRQVVVSAMFESTLQVAFTRARSNLMEIFSFMPATSR